MTLTPLRPLPIHSPNPCGLSSLAIRDLVAVLGGELRLAEMPPLGGWWEPIRRVVTDINAVGRGDVWWAADAPAEQHTCWACQAFVQGAAGVVSSATRATPWPGTFAMSVSEPAGALETVVRHVRSKYRGQVVAVAEELPKPEQLAPLARLLASALAPGGFVRRPLATLADLVTLPMDDPRAVLSWKLFQNAKQDAVLRLSRPHVAVISSPPLSEQAHEAAISLLSHLPDQGLAVLPADWRAGREAAEAAGISVLVLDTSEPLQREQASATAVAEALGVPALAVELAARRLGREQTKPSRAAA